MAKSSISFATGKVAPIRPKRPYGDFPLFPHATKRWAKKIRGKFHYFGRWDKSPDGDWQAALELYQQQRDDLHAGRQPREAGHGMVLRDLINHFLTAKEMLVGSGDIVARTFRDYYDVCGRTLRFFGHPRLVDDITAEDFAAFPRKTSQKPAVRSRWRTILPACEFCSSGVLIPAWSISQCDTANRFRNPPRQHCVSLARHADRECFRQKTSGG